MYSKMDWAMRAALQITRGDMAEARRAANIIRAWERKRHPLPLKPTDEVFAWDSEKNELVPLAEWRKNQAS